MKTYLISFSGRKGNDIYHEALVRTGHSKEEVVGALYSEKLEQDFDYIAITAKRMSLMLNEQNVLVIENYD